jgi:low affinity Fe/Cu permease
MSVWLNTQMNKVNNARRLEVAKVGADSGRKQIQGDGFGKFAAAASSWLGSKWAFVGAIVIILVWALTGPIFHYSDTWQLVINTGTTIITFLMVFIIQNTQNRDARAINLKLDELIHAIDTAKNQMMDIEKLSDEELDVIHEKYTQMRADCVDDEGEVKP